MGAGSVFIFLNKNADKESGMSRALRNIRILLRCTFLASALALASGCNPPGSQSTFTSTAIVTTASSTPGSNVMAAQVVFSVNANGSFNTPPITGTPAVPGQGLQAVRLFNADGSTLAVSPTDPNWPSWISSVELGITGPSALYTLPNGTSYASNPSCARFATAAEAPGGASAATCNFGNGNVPCGAPAGQFRVSEVDCNYGFDANNKGVGPGNGSGGDTVYVRANLNRHALGTTENIMVTLSYTAASYYPADPNPTDCFTGPGGSFQAESCSDFSWKVFMRHSPTESAVQPFMMFIPPTFSYTANNPNKTSGTTPVTKQFIVPISGDSRLQTIQVSRILSTLKSSDANFNAACDVPGQHLSASPGSPGGSSPLCAGVILYTMTLFRI